MQSVYFGDDVVMRMQRSDCKAKKSTLMISHDNDLVVNAYQWDGLE